jgi:hypothetical protein
MTDGCYTNQEEDRLASTWSQIWTEELIPPHPPTPWPPWTNEALSICLAKSQLLGLEQRAHPWWLYLGAHRPL